MKKKMNNKLLAILMSLSMVFALMPVQMAFAGGEQPVIWIGGTQVTSTNLSGEGWSYDPATATLTLDNPVITGLHEHAMIYIEGDLTIRGKADLTTEPNKVIVGKKGTLTFADCKMDLKSTNSYAVWCYGDIEICGGNMTFTGGRFESALYGENITISGGMVTGEGGEGISADGNFTITGGTVTGIGIERTGIKALGTLTIGPDVTKVSAEGKVYEVWSGAVTAGSIDKQDGVQITKPTSGKIGRNGKYACIVDDQDAVSTVAEFTPVPTYKISTYAELKEFSRIVNDGETSAYAKLTADIECDDELWVPIGTYSQKYTGSFDGQGHTITALSNGECKNDDQGLFGCIGSAEQYGTLDWKIFLSKVLDMSAEWQETYKMKEQ